MELDREDQHSGKNLSNLWSTSSDLAYCSAPGVNEKANYLVDPTTPEGYLTRISFSTKVKTKATGFYNPNLLPYPAGSEVPYFAIVRLSHRVNGLMLRHDLAYCDLKWADSRTINSRILECTSPGTILDFGTEWTGTEEACKRHPFLVLRQGHTDPRVFFSPLGEPLMIVGTNGIHNCLGLFVIDLRVLIPELAEKMQITELPIRFGNMTELGRPDLQEIEKNWFMIYDAIDSNREYLHYDFTNRALATLEPPSDPAMYNSIAKPSPELITGLLQNFRKGSYSANDLHQASNSLLVTMCDFPCVPTIHNTVLIELMHVKYANYYRLYYRRFAIIMNATAPFDVIGRTENIMYAGVDSEMMVYTVSVVWDKQHFHRHEPWNETIHGTPDPAQGKNPFVSDGYHGWLDDILMINVGLDDHNSGVIHTTARDLLDCIKLVQ
ncbi:uncharacterized protein V1516DRAFT_663627 [Lipomyces oligophaga]|uniref:uncharacterized protein n=1 Tax=Lipomyces oligophaga TaxID=45792 RepID=UPI0034CF0A0E